MIIYKQKPSVFKRLFMIVVIITAILVMPFESYASSPEAVFTDIEESGYDKAVKFLCAMDVMKGYDDNTFQPDNIMTRSEFAVICVRILGLEDFAARQEFAKPFTDVDEQYYWAAGYIKAVSEMGYLNGYGNGNFGPGDYITYEQAVKVLVSMLGYEIYATAKGGYPTGYLITAGEIGLLRGAEGGGSSPATRGIIAQFISNALNINILQPSKIGDRNEYTAVEGKTLLSENLKIIKSSGTITAVGQNSIIGGRALKENEAEIDGETIFNSGNTNPELYLGFKTDYYYTEEIGEANNTLVYIEPYKNKNIILELDSENISEKSGRRSIFYLEDEDNSGRLKEAKLSSTAYMVYNGKAYSEPQDSDFRPKTGAVTLLDWEGDNIYDVVYVNSYEIVVVDAVSPSVNKIYNKLDQFKESEDGQQEYIVDVTDNQKKVEIWLGGERINLRDLREWDILNLKRSKDESYIIIDVSRSKIQGEVSETSDDMVVIDGKDYKISPLVDITIGVGDKYAYYLDLRGRISAVNIKDSMSGSMSYGLLINVNREESGIERAVVFRVLTEKGTIENIKGAKIFFLDGEKKDASDVTAEFNGQMPKVINYELNEASQIRRIDIPEPYKIIGKEGTAPYEMEFRVFRQGLFWKNTSTNISDENTIYRIDNAVVFLHYDLNTVKSTGSEEEIYKVVKFNELIDCSTFEKVTLYEMKQGLTAKAAHITITDSFPLGSGLPSPFLVEKVTQAVDNDGSHVQKIHGLCDNKETELYGINNNVFNGVRKGDIINVIRNTRGQAVAVTKNILNNELPPRISTSADKDSEFAPRVIYFNSGQVTDIDNDTKSVFIDERSHVLAQSSIYVYDYSNDIMSKGVFEDIDRDSVVYIFTKWNVPVVTVVYHNK